MQDKSPTTKPPQPVIESPNAEPVTDRERQEKTIGLHFPSVPKEKKILTANITLPSGAMAEIRESGYEDDRILANPALQESGDAFDMWIASCTVNLNGKSPVEPEHIISLLVGDRIYLAIKIVQLSYGDQIEFDVDCPYDRTPNMCGVDIPEILKSYIAYPPPDKREFSFTLKSGHVATYGFNTGLRLRMLRSRKDLSILDPIAMRLKSLDGTPAHEQTWNELCARDRADLMSEIIRTPEGGIDTTVRVTCKKCGKPFATLLEDNVGFFLPGLRRG